MQTQSSVVAFNWKIAGEAGQGVMLAAQLLAKMAKRHGLNAFNYLEYPSLIRGGHQTGQVWASFGNATCQRRDLDLIIIYSQVGFELHQAEITPETQVVYNQDFGDLAPEILTKWGQQTKSMPISSWGKETTGTTLAGNVVALGISAAALGLDPQICQTVIAEEFKGKAELIKTNQAAFEKGYQAAGQDLKCRSKIVAQPDQQLLMTGNEALGLGAVAGGLQFYSAYPMTPATGLLHFLSEHKSQLPIVVKQVEDEIGAINEAIGAAITGARAMTGSSGGGFALMVEALSFAGTAEVPLVILEAQRKGPASGVPTWTEQADLSFILTAGHGDFPKIVLTPGTVAEHYELAKLALQLAEKYQLPVIIASDKYILESHQTFAKPPAVTTNERFGLVDQAQLGADQKYQRYQLTADGVSPRTLPGQEFGQALTNSYEHDQAGWATEEGPEIVAQVDKRALKMTTLLKDLPQPQLIGPTKAEVTLVGWGSTVNVFLALLDQAKPGIVNAIHLPCVKPFPVAAFTKMAKSAKKLIMVEGNANGQVEQLIAQETGIKMSDHWRRYDGRPFYSEDFLKNLGQ